MRSGMAGMSGLPLPSLSLLRRWRRRRPEGMLSLVLLVLASMVARGSSIQSAIFTYDSFDVEVTDPLSAMNAL